MAFSERQGHRTPPHPRIAATAPRQRAGPERPLDLALAIDEEVDRLVRALRLARPKQRHAIARHLRQAKLSLTTIRLGRTARWLLAHLAVIKHCIDIALGLPGAAR